MDLTLWGLFASAFISATLLPGGSEALVAYLHATDSYPAWVLLTVAGVGNTLGGMTSWGLGRLLARRFPAAPLEDTRRRRALHYLQRWGSPALLFSWLPLIGDPLCVVAGWLRMAWLPCLLFIAIGKTARYWAVLSVSAGGS